jgi:hypothetical protein
MRAVAAAVAAALATQPACHANKRNVAVGVGGACLVVGAGIAGAGDDQPGENKSGDAAVALVVVGLVVVGVALGASAAK